MSSTLATTRLPAPIANSVSVAAGVSETIRCGSAGIATCVPSSSVTVTGKAGAGVAGAVPSPSRRGPSSSWRPAARSGRRPTGRTREDQRSEERNEENGEDRERAGRGARRRARTEWRSHGWVSDRGVRTGAGPGTTGTAAVSRSGASWSLPLSRRSCIHRGSATGLPSLGDGSP